MFANKKLVHLNLVKCSWVHPIYSYDLFIIPKATTDWQEPLMSWYPTVAWLSGVLAQELRHIRRDDRPSLSFVQKRDFNVGCWEPALLYKYFLCLDTIAYDCGLAQTISCGWWRQRFAISCKLIHLRKTGIELGACCQSSNMLPWCLIFYSMTSNFFAQSLHCLSYAYIGLVYALKWSIRTKHDNARREIVNHVSQIWRVFFVLREV